MKRFREDRFAADGIAIAALPPPRFVSNAVPLKLWIHPAFCDAQRASLRFGIALQRFRKVLRGVDGLLRYDVKTLFLFVFCHRAVVLEPAGEESVRFLRVLHPFQAVVHIQLLHPGCLPGQLCTKADRTRQPGGLLFQHCLLRLDCFGQRLFPTENALNGGQRQIQHPKHPDQFQSPDVFGGVIPVGIAPVAGRRQQPFFFVKADVGAGDPALFRSLFDVHLLHLRPYTTP